MNKTKNYISKVIKMRKTDFSKTNTIALKKGRNKFKGHILDKSIHYYRMWFHLVRLVIDCETHKIKFGRHNQFKVKLNKRFYKDWEIDKYLDSSFDNWFADKIHFFAEEKASLVKKGDESDDYLYIKFNRRQRKEDVIRQVRTLLKNEKYKSQAKYQIKNQYKYFYLHQQYNVLIMRIEGKSAVEIADFFDKTYRLYSEKVSSSYSSLRRLFRSSERLVIDVSKGDF